MTSNDASNLLLSTETLWHTKLILASKSPRRSEMLTMIGSKDEHQIVPSPLDEEPAQVELQAMEVKPSECVKKLAEKKCVALVNNLELLSLDSDNHPTIVIGSDTIVNLDSNALEKPNDKNHAFDMLATSSST